MKKILLFIVFALAITELHAQFVHVIKADSVLITNDSCTAELNLENSTKHIKGFLYNKGNGRTEFRKMVKLNDSTLVFGDDTLSISGNFKNFANADLTFTGDRIHNGAYKNLTLNNFKKIDLKANNAASTPFGQIYIDSSGEFFVHSYGIGSTAKSFIEIDTNWIFMGHNQPSFTDAGVSYAELMLMPQSWGDGFNVTVGSGNSGNTFQSGSMGISYNGTSNISAKGNEPNKKANISVSGGQEGISPTIHLRVDTTDGPAAGIFSTFTQTPLFFEFNNLFHSLSTPLDFRLKTLPVSVDTSAQKPLTVDSDGRVYKSGSWPSIPYSLQQVTNNGNSTTNTIKPYPSALPIGANTDSVVVWSASDSLLKKIGSKQTFAQTATVTISGTTDQTTLISSGTGNLTIPTASWFVGKTFKVVVHGTYSTSSTNPPSLTIKIKLGTTVIATGTVNLSANKSDVSYEGRAEFTCRATGSSGTVFAMGMISTADGAIKKLNNGITAFAVDLSTNQTLNITATLSDASAGNAVSAYVILLEAMN